MSFLQELKRELKEKGKLENSSKKTVDFLERAYLKDNPCCEKCGNTSNLTYDHIIPQTILNDFNIDPRVEFWEENSRTLCHACNHIKSNHLDFTTPKTKELLTQLLNQYGN